MKRKKKYILILLLTFISIGFAFLTTNLSINGVSIIKRSVFDVHFENLVDDSENVELQIPAKISDDKKSVNFEVTLDSPGDYYYFYVNVVNKGTMDVMLNEYLISELNEEQKNVIDIEVTYADGGNLSKYDLLEENSVETLKVLVKYKDDINANQLPNSDSDFELSLTTTYSQADENARQRHREADIIKPVIKFYETKTISNNKWQKDLSLNVKVIDNDSIKSTKYCVTKEDDCTPDQAVQLTNNIYTYTFNSNENQILCFEAIDNSDNVSKKCSKKYSIDTQRPVIDDLMVELIDNSLSIQVVGTDEYSGIAKYYYSIDNGQHFVTSSNENYTFTNLSVNVDYNIVVYAEDMAGNQSLIYNYDDIIRVAKITYDYNFNMLDKLEDVDLVESSLADYSIKNNVVTVTGKQANDGWVQTPYGAVFDKTKTYYISSTIDGVWGDKSIEGSQEMFLNNYQDINNDFVYINNNYVEFKVKNNTRYNLRFDVNAAGVSRSFSNIFISEYENKYNLDHNNITNLPQLKKDNYTFEGWYKDKDFTQEVTEDTIIDGSIRLYAKWRKNKVTINYNINGGTIISKGYSADSKGIVHTASYDFDQTLENNGLLNYNNPDYLNVIKVGYNGKESEEWNTQADGRGKSFNQASEYSLSDFCDLRKSDCTVDLYINWEKKNDLTVHLVDEKQNYDDLIVKYNDTIKLPSPKLPGWALVGWYADPTPVKYNGYYTVVPSELVSKEVKTGKRITENMTLYSKWVEGSWLDVNGRIDGVSITSLKGYVTFDLYINDRKIGNDSSDFYSVTGVGNTYKIDDIKVADGYNLIECNNPLEGTIGDSNLSIVFILETIS